MADDNTKSHTKDVPPTTAKGRALRRTTEDAANQSTVTSRDIDEAVRFWQAKAPRQFKGLIDATLDDDTSDEASDDAD